jgi:hypothetical protein
MYCEHARQQLQQNEGKQDQDYSAALFDHLETCPDCWNFAASLWQKEAVGDAAEHSISTFEVDCALNRAWSAQPRRKPMAVPGSFRQLAVAAIVVVAVSAVLLQFRDNGSTLPRQGNPATIVINPANVRYVDFMLTSADAHREATITLALDENLVLAGYPGMREISWATSLQAGDNQLTLPLQLQNDEHGVITVNVESGGLQKQMMFTVQPPEPEQHTQVI